MGTTALAQTGAPPRPMRIAAGRGDLRLQTMEALSDEELIARARHDPTEAPRCLEVLFARLYPRVAGWCLTFCADRDEAADVAQEVFIKVQAKLDAFRGESRFTTWLYSVTRRVAIDHGLAARRRQRFAEPEASAPEAADPAPRADDDLGREQVLQRLRDSMERNLEPLEARVVYLHYVDGMSLPAITRLLGFDNRSGAKAYLVGGMRKLRRHFGPWLAREQGLGAGHAE